MTESIYGKWKRLTEDREGRVTPQRKTKMVERKFLEITSDPIKVTDEAWNKLKSLRMVLARLF